ncbi:MAG: methyltransferase domain-containing protein [Solirubrobacterales bacterium]|nr:methyltransferase domain-containing protein [Solirubrobacterales bacterium]
MAIPDEAQRGFQLGAEAYERGRPGYSRELMDWLAGQLALRPGRIVLDVGAGTGKLTRELVATGARVLAVEPVRGMREILERVVPDADIREGTAEALPFADQAIDAVTVASAFHWFDAPAALAEFQRVLRPGGRLALMWQRRRSDQPIHQAIDAIIGPHRGRRRRHEDGSWRARVMESGRFAFVAETRLPFEQRLDPDGLVDRIGSISFVAGLPGPDRDDVLRRIRELAERTPPPIRLGYTSELFVYETV